MYLINSDEFVEKVINDTSEDLVVVDFYSTTCMPCRHLETIMLGVEKDYADRHIKFYKLNILEDDKHPIYYGVTTLPTLLFFVNGKVFDRHLGVIDYDDFGEIVEEYEKIYKTEETK